MKRGQMMKRAIQTIIIVICIGGAVVGFSTGYAIADGPPLEEINVTLNVTPITVEPWPPPLNFSGSSIIFEPSPRFIPWPIVFLPLPGGVSLAPTPMPLIFELAEFFPPISPGMPHPVDKFYFHISPLFELISAPILHPLMGLWVHPLDMLH